MCPLTAPAAPAPERAAATLTDLRVAAALTDARVRVDSGFLIVSDTGAYASLCGPEYTRRSRATTASISMVARMI